MYNDFFVLDFVYLIECVNCGYVNSVFDEIEVVVRDRISVIFGLFEDICLYDDGNYLFLDEVVEERWRGFGEDVFFEMMVEFKYCKSFDVVRWFGDFEESVYDNNI